MTMVDDFSGIKNFENSFKRHILRRNSQENLNISKSVSQKLLNNKTKSVSNIMKCKRSKIL